MYVHTHTHILIYTYKVFAVKGSSVVKRDRFAARVYIYKVR